MSASHAGSPSDAPQVNEDMGARISRLEMHMQQSSEAMRHQAELVATLTSVSESILRRLDSPLLASAGGDEQLAAMRELAPMTLERQSGGDADDVRRDLVAAMASAARREGVSTRHDDRPLALEAAAFASNASRSNFPEAFNSVSFINVQADGTAAGGPRERRAPGEVARRWTLLTRQSMPQDGSCAAPPVPRCLYDPEVDGAGHQVRIDNDFDPAAAARGSPTRAGVASALGYGPESVDLSEGVQSLARPSIALRQPTEGTSISLMDKDVEVFTGVLVVRKAAAGGGMILEGDPTEWLTRAYSKLRERRISPDRWVLTLSPRLSPTVRHQFRWHFGPLLPRRDQVLAETMFPFTAPPAECDVFEAVSFEDFWPWMLGQYLRPAHLNAARSMWHAMGDRTSTLATLAEDTYEFTRLLLRSDLMDAVLRSDEVAMRNLVLSDTIERREIYRRMLPEEVCWHITQTESFRLLSEDEALGLTGVAASLNSSRLPPAAAGELTLAQLQHAASRSAEILHREATRDGARLHSLLLGEEPETARLLALEAAVQGMALDAELQADHQAPDDLTLFNVVATHMPDAPPPHVIQQRREARQCLACGESSSHWRFQDCPKVKAQPQLVQVLREWIRRDRATRGRVVEGRAAEGVRRADHGDHRRRPPRPQMEQVREQLHTAIAALQSMAASLSPQLEEQDDSDDEVAGSSRHHS
jgi:hypothetical protein